MDQKTKKWCKCDTLSLKRINVSCHKKTIISESEIVNQVVVMLRHQLHQQETVVMSRHQWHHKRRKSQKELTLELIKRQQKKVHSRDTKEHQKLARMMQSDGLQAVKMVYPHGWWENGKLVVYEGLIRKLYAPKKY